MTTRDDRFERTLRSWMTDSVTGDGAATIETAAVEAARRRRQRPTWLVALRRTTWDGARPTSSLPRSRLLVVAAILAVAAVGGGVVGSGAFRWNEGLVVPPAVETPSPAPTASPAPTSSPRATPPVDLPAPYPSRRPLSETIVDYLVAHGQSVTPVPGAVPDAFVEAALQDVRPQGFGVERYYALVTCIDPSKGCAEVGSTGTGDERGIWFSYGQYVRAVDAVTLERVLIERVLIDVSTSGRGRPRT